MLADSRQSIGEKGTLLYMAPEQLERKPISPMTDIFALGIVCYETLTQRRPFDGKSEDEIVQAILHHIPPPVSEINPAVSFSISRVIHKAMAKQSYNRFSSTAEFSECLQKALRNEPIEIFNETRIRPRIQRAGNAFEQADYQYANEILSELEAEGHVDPEISRLRRQIDQAVRQKTISQLLESARKRFEEGEFLLARQKIQEILQIDSNNATALGLQSKIESRSTELKIEDWFQLAQQHINNHAYRHAREALQNVLQLRPKETRALQLMAEVNHKEQEYLKLRQEKERNYQAALDAWQNGEVSAALAKLESVLALDIRAPDSTNPERAAIYQNFYNQVRSEHDTISNSYAEARRYLVDRNFTKALGICDKLLSKYPAQALFQALKFDVEEQQRQELSAYIAEIDRRVEAERDLDRRMGILEEAVARHPGEVHFERSLRSTRDKRDLVDSIVTKARHLENQGNFGEALGQWEILRNIYTRYPGLELEVERLTKRRDQLVKTEAKGRWVEQLDRLMDLGDYARTLDLLQSAEAEFPDDEEFAELRKQAQQGLAGAARAQELLTRGQELVSDNQFEEGLSTLRAAYQLDSRNASIRDALLEGLVENARTLVDKDWRSVEGLVMEALDLDPDHALAKSIRTIVSDHKREESVSNCLAKARQLRVNGDLKGAQTLVQRALALLPKEPRLLQLQAALEKALSESRRRDLEEIRRLSRDVDSAANPDMATTIQERADSISRLHPDDPELQTAVINVRQRLATSKETLPGEGSLQPLKTGADFSEFSRTELISQDGKQEVTQPASREDSEREKQSGEFFVGIRGQLAIRVAKLAEIVKVLSSHFQSDHQVRLARILWIPVLGLLAVALVFFVLNYRSRQHERRQAAIQMAALYPCEVQTSPEGATIRVNNELKGISPLELRLPAGHYDLEATKDGFQAIRQTLTITMGSVSPYSLALTLLPLPQTLQIKSDLESGKVWLGEELIGELQNGQFQLENLPPGPQTLRVAGGRYDASVNFESSAGSCTLLSGPITAKELRVLLIAGFGGLLRIHSNVTPAKVSLDGQPAGDLGPDGLELKAVPPGSHELSLGEGKDLIKVIVEVGPTPLFTAFLSSDRNVGSLLVVTGEDNVQVLLDGKAYSRQTSKGKILIPNRAVKQYVVKVVRDGYESDPPQHVVELRKGEETRLEFKLHPVPTTASLVINGATPESQVILDGNPIGSVQADGSFSVVITKLGQHTLEIQKQGYRFRRIQKEFVAGKSLQIEGEEFGPPEKLVGTVQLVLSPPDSRVTYRGINEGTSHLVSGNTLELPEGSYVVTAMASGYEQLQERLQVAVGQTQTIALHLNRLKPSSHGMDKWEDEAGWKVDGEWHVRRGGNFVLYGVTPLAGRIEFTAMLRKTGIIRKNPLQWIIGYRDEKNHVLFQISRNFFSRIEVYNGKKTEQKTPYTLKQASEIYTIRVLVEPGSVIHQVYDGKSWHNLDNWSVTGKNLTEGKFGFYIPGNDEVALSRFIFQPK